MEICGEIYSKSSVARCWKSHYFQGENMEITLISGSNCLWIPLCLDTQSFICHVLWRGDISCLSFVVKVFLESRCAQVLELQSFKRVAFVTTAGDAFVRTRKQRQLTGKTNTNLADFTAINIGQKTTPGQKCTHPKKEHWVAYKWIALNKKGVADTRLQI